MAAPPGTLEPLFGRETSIILHAWAQSVWQPDLRVWDRAASRSCGVTQNVERPRNRKELAAYLQQVVEFEGRTRLRLPNYLILFELLAQDQNMQWTPLFQLQMDIVSSATGIFFLNGAPVVMTALVGPYVAGPRPASASVVDSSPGSSDDDDDDDDDDDADSSDSSSGASFSSSAWSATDWSN